MPTKTGQVSSATFTIAGETITDILSLKNDSPTVMVEQLVYDGTAITFTASAKSNHPNVIVYTGVFDRATDSWTYTYSGDPWTSTILLATTLGKREQPSATSTADGKKPKITQHSKSSVVDSDLVMKAKKVETVSILDEEPGHMTLNLKAATQKEYPTTKVTLIEHDGTALTLTPTTNSNGRTILVTEDPENSQETCTVSVFMDVDRVVSMHNHCVKTGRHMVTKTVTHQDHFDLTAPPTTEAHPLVASLASPSVVTKVITQTVTKYSRYGHRTCCNRDGRDAEINYMLATKTMVDLGSTTVSLSKNIQLLNNSTLLMVPFQAQATLVPLAWDSQYLNGWEHVMDMDLASIRAMYPEADWEEIPRMAYQMRRRHGDIDPERSLKYAFVMAMRSLRSQYEYHPITTKTSVRLRNGDVVALTAPTQTIRGHVYSVDPKMKYMMWNPHNAVAPTQACVGDHDKYGKELHSNKTECRLQRCMWDFMKPINITTVQPMAMYDSRGHINHNWFTQSTELHETHWGTTEERGLYYPASLAWKITNKTASAHMARQTPDDLPKKIENRVHGDPECWDIDTCYDTCSEQAKEKRDPDILKWILPPILGVIALAALCCLLACCWHRRRRRDPERRHSSVIPEKLRRKSSHPQEVIVNTVTGTTTDTAGHPVDPHTAVETAAIAGTAAANENGRGTTGRRAEEGRGRVNFEDGGQPGTDAPGTEHTEEHPTESTEPKPVPDKDGATGTGRQGPDVGSMRGRKRNRPEGAGGLLGL